VASAVKIKFSPRLIQLAFNGFDLWREFCGRSGPVLALLKKVAVHPDPRVTDGLKKVTAPAVHNFVLWSYDEPKRITPTARENSG
jgi:hypothetical protein